MAAPNDLSHAPALAGLREVLHSQGVDAALGYISDRSTHRFAGIYRFDAATLRTRHFVDRDNPRAEPPADIPILSSYCVFVRESGNPFAVEDSHTDPRVDGHPKQSQLRSYCGVPLLDEHGAMYGTACVYDLVPRDVSPLELALLEALGPLLIEHTRRQDPALARPS